MRYLIKILGAIFIIGAGAGYGIILSNDIKKRLNELREIKKVMFLLKGEIEYGMTPIMDAFAEISKRCNGEIRRILECLCKGAPKDENLDELWTRTMTSELSTTCLGKDEKERFITLSHSLGLPDKKMQLHAIDNYLDELNMSIETLASEIPTKTKLYRCLSLMFGIIITIIIV